MKKVTSIAANTSLTTVVRVIDTGNTTLLSFSRHNNIWEEQILQPTYSRGYYLGFAAAVSDDGLTVIISSVYNEVVELDDGGRVEVYKFTDGTWHLAQTLQSDIPLPGACFGFSLDIDASGDCIVVGSTLSDAGAGAALIFKNIEGRYEQVQKLVPGPQISPAASFGNAVKLSIDLSVLLIGASLDSSEELDIYHDGSVSKYTLDTDETYTYTSLYKGVDNSNSRLLGRSIDTSEFGDVILLGTNVNANTTHNVLQAISDDGAEISYRVINVARGPGDENTVKISQDGTVICSAEMSVVNEEPTITIATLVLSDGEWNPLAVIEHINLDIDSTRELKIAWNSDLTTALIGNASVDLISGVSTKIRG